MFEPGGMGNPAPPVFAALLLAGSPTAAAVSAI
jgi:hypothetical protein